MILVSPYSCLCPTHWSQVLSREWRCSWSSADRRSSNYIWVNTNFDSSQGATYIRGLISYPSGLLHWHWENHMILKNYYGNQVPYRWPLAMIYVPDTFANQCIQPHGCLNMTIDYQSIVLLSKLDWPVSYSHKKTLCDHKERTHLTFPFANCNWFLCVSKSKRQDEQNFANEMFKIIFL